MRTRARQQGGLSLIELLMVIAIMGILVGLVMPSSNPSICDQLRSTAEILKTDLAYGRSLAVTNNSTYRITFDTDRNRYVLEHSGSNPALDTLPDSAFRSPGDPPDQHIVDLDELPRVGPPVSIAAAATLGATPQRVADVEFGPLGETTRSQQTTIWLGCGRDSDRRYLALEVNPVTGLAEIGDFTAEGPPAAVKSEIIVAPSLP